MAGTSNGNTVEERERARAMGSSASGSGMLSIVGTPIGNLGDLSARAAQTLSNADAIYCEDTRVTSKLLAHLQLSKPLVRCDDNVMNRRASEVIERVQRGERIAYASDAGMPSVSDPGQVLISQARACGVPVEVIPGPSAGITALVMSGIPSDRFFFEGFLPRKHNERVRRLRRLSIVPAALIMYESPHRVEASLKAIAEVFPNRGVALCREITKLHEEVLRDTASNLIEIIQGRGGLKGEIVLVIEPPTEQELAAAEVALFGSACGAGAYVTGQEGAEVCADSFGAQPAAIDPGAALQRDIAQALEAGESANALAKRLSQRYSLKKRDVYARILELQSAED